MSSSHSSSSESSESEDADGVENDGQIAPETVVIILRGLGLAKDAATKDAAVWLANLEEQLLEFAQQRQNETDKVEEADIDIEEEAPPEKKYAIKYFETIPHLLWWTLSRSVLQKKKNVFFFLSKLTHCVQCICIW